MQTKRTLDIFQSVVEIVIIIHATVSDEPFIREQKREKRKKVEMRTKFFKLFKAIIYMIIFLRLAYEDKS